MNRPHYRGICPPELSDDLVARQPGVRLLDFVCHEQFECVESGVLGNQVLVWRDTGDPWRARGELVVQYQLARSEAQTLSATERSHDDDEFLVDDSRRRFIRKDDRWGGIETASVRCGGFIVHFGAGFSGHGSLRGSMRNNQEHECK